MDKTKGTAMSDKCASWLSRAPMPDVEKWLKSLYVDNILVVSKGGENTASAFAEYGKKLLVDKILEQYADLRKPVSKNTPVNSGEELLGVLHPAR